jgi:hypothetical protein
MTLKYLSNNFKVLQTNILHYDKERYIVTSFMSYWVTTEIRLEHG